MIDRALRLHTSALIDPLGGCFSRGQAAVSYPEAMLTLVVLSLLSGDDWAPMPGSVKLPDLSPQARYEAATRYLAAGKPGEASAILDPLIAEFPRVPEYCAARAQAQLGWAIVTWAARERSLSFLDRFLPAMLEPGAAPLFDATPGHADDPRLLLHGVLPAARKRAVFTETFLEVLLPGLERVGIASTQARRWLERRPFP